jgi:hypothetical protein
MPVLAAANKCSLLMASAGHEGKGFAVSNYKVACVKRVVETVGVS